MSSESSDSHRSNRNAVESSSDYIGLTKSALELISSSNPVTRLAYGIVQWLGRECISETDFTWTFERTRGLAYPNEHGLIIR